jgi:hypothetical protein
MATPQEEKALRDRVLSLLWSDAARRIDFELDGISIDGQAFRWVAHAVVTKQLNNKGIGFRFGHVDPSASAQYDPDENLFDFPDTNYGLTPFQRRSIIHEAVHAWLDLRIPEVQTDRDAVLRALRMKPAVMDEAAAFVADSLFHIYDTTPARSMPIPPYWVSEQHRAEAYRIAVSIMNNPGAVVAEADATALEKAILDHPSYRELKANPVMTYKNNGL